MSLFRYSVILGNLGNTCDRFLASGYKERLDRATMIRQAAAIPGVTGIELVGTWDVDEATLAETGRMIADAGLTVVSVIPDVFSHRRWGRGSLASPDAAIRRAAVAEVDRWSDVAAALGCDLINLWPGQDGFDYSLAADYLEERAWFSEGLAACARHAAGKGVRVALEYKIKEPRTHSYLARAGDTLLVARDCPADNVGITIDTGHAFMAYENVGDAIALITHHRGKLMHMHFNDNHGGWDDDMIAGSVRLVEYLEILYWLRRVGYQGWLSMDQYPYREDGAGAVGASVLFLRKLEGLLERIGIAEVEALIRRRDPVATSTFIRERLIA